MSATAEAKCAGRCAGMSAGAWRGRAHLRTTAHAAWGSPTHRRMKAEPVLRCKRLKLAPAGKSRTALGAAAAARDRELDVLATHFACSGTISSISWAAGSGPPSRLERW